MRRCVIQFLLLIAVLLGTTPVGWAEDFSRGVAEGAAVFFEETESGRVDLNDPGAADPAILSILSSCPSSGNGTTFSYDSQGRLTSQSDPAGTIAFTYDNNGNPLTVTEGTAVLSRTYDALNRPVSYTNVAGETISYHYNPNGLLEQIVYPGNRAVNYTYTRLNQLKTVTDWAGRVTTYEWDILGRNTRIIRPNGTTRENRYDVAGRLISYQERAGMGDLIGYSSFGYDADNQLRTRYRLPGAFDAPVSEPPVTASYDDDNRLTSFNGVAVTHDADGNMTQGPLGGAAAVGYSYDARNRLTGVGGASFGYDAENNRIAQTDGTGTTRYLVDPHGDALPRVLVKAAPDGTKTTYVYGIGLAYEIAEPPSGDPRLRYYHFDNLGSTVALTDGTGVVTDRAEYGVYGETIHRSGTTETPFLYVGQFGVQTDGTGLHYMRARYYNPLLMRFINADPIGFAGGMNWYGYGNNSPLMFIDPSGFCGESGGANWLSGIASLAYMLPVPLRQGVEMGMSTAHSALTSYGIYRAGRENGYGLTKATVTAGSVFVGDFTGITGLTTAVMGETFQRNGLDVSVRKMGTSERIITGSVSAVQLGATAYGGVKIATSSRAVSLIDDAARTPVGRSGKSMSVPGPQNVRTVINGREYSGHALDQMQGRGFVPSVVENTIKQGTTFPTRAGTTGVYDAVNNIRVITDTATGRVVTVIPGPP